MLALFCLMLLAAPLTDAWKSSQPRLHFQHSELMRSGRLVSLSMPAGDLNSLLPDEDGRRLYIGMKDHLLSTSLDDITQNPRKIYWPANPDRIQDCTMAGKTLEMDCANFLRVLERYNQTHLYACGTGAFNPRCAFIPTNLFLRAEEQTLQDEDTESGRGKCPFDPHQRTATAIIDGELYAGISSDFLSHDTAFIRSLGERHVIRTEQYDSTWLQGAEFVHVTAMSESDNEEDDKVYVFFTERAQEAEGAAGKVLYSRVARVCKNDIGGQRSLVNKWSTFQKARIVCSVPGPDGIQTHFDKLQDIFIQHGRDKKNPLVYGLFTTTSNVLNGSAVCVYRMQDIIRAFKGNFLHREGHQYKLTEYTGRVPYPRPGTCPSSTYGGFRSTREYPDDVIFFSRTHPLMQEVVRPLGGQPLLIRVGVPYKLTRLLVDRVEAVDGQHDVMFIGTDSGLVLKVLHFPKANRQNQEVTLEQLQVFKHKSAITAMTLSKKKWLFAGSAEGVVQLGLFQCDLYGQACAECCLARDPYCTWDGHSCSQFMPTGRRRNIRQVNDDGNPLNQCVRQGAGLQVEAEEKTLVVAVGNSTYLECLPKSHHATITWYKDIGENSLEQHKVTSGEQLVVIDRGILIPRAELNHAGVYHCQLEEHGFRWTAVTIRLTVWSPVLHPSLGATQPWYQDVMALINHSKLERHCKELSQRHNSRESVNHRANKQDRKRTERHRHRGGEKKEKGKGRKHRSRMQSSAQRLPRSA
ncbi:sema domain, immunoglobulin domain (Ig), short basic domain, secreted, (semaphorin) 3H isoform 1 precursor [Danio rerio]|uniref:sema domain, immunoglobulin domain (Ig), short basic domain, secreted, (semaphorin) 3H isoform 1 precursor n=1 Tax=Danio rerio TaxID=7955 RepID=UPI00005680F9|nr:sema domain, immunoglobulin domain (Ig), short basic domain, secreted, (semaphorin) 3H isoform 1 precursor [Danio rerio]|eukprot:NP_571125.2 sema domain, immunoglobulin domain (Ig), short basic domain, secreted, (semaphorin) 3H isoform 1 precursor [Danio rerio]